MTQMRPNRAKATLQAGEIVACVGGIPDADTIDVMGPSGLDAVWIESEHGPVDFGDIADMTRACDLWGITSIVRVNWNEPALIYRTLDRGAQGIVVPHVDTREDAERMVDAAKFAPIGHRGMYVGRQGHGRPRPHILDLLTV